MPRRRADNTRRTQRKNKTLIVNDENGSGGCGGCESASRDRKAHGKIFVKMINYTISYVQLSHVFCSRLASRVSSQNT